MRRIPLISLLIFSSFLFSFQVDAQKIYTAQVLIKTSSSSVILRQLEADIRNRFKQQDNFELIKVFKEPNTTMSNSLKLRNTVASHPVYRYYNLFYAGELTLEKLMDELRLVKGITYVQPRFIPQLAGIPNDSLINRISAHYELIRLYAAWDIQMGNPNVVVGITDSGTDLEHPDLIKNFARNEADPINGLDDDADGYVDNYLGWDVAENDNNPQIDKSAHGVHMSGIIAAEPNNLIGIAGIGYQCRILPVKIANDESGELIAAYEGVKYAADAGVDIINCSWGGYDAGDFERDVIDYALEKNCLIVAAAGNDDADRIYFPAAFPDVIAVANTDTNDRKAFNSNYHSLIDLTAPGVGFTSTWANNLYQSISGTSVSAAVVSGGLALLKSMYPDLNNSEIKDRLLQTTDDIKAVNDEFSNKLGTGRLNLLRAMMNDIQPFEQRKDGLIYPNPIQQGVNSTLGIIHYLTNESAVDVELFDQLGKSCESWQFSTMPEGLNKMEIQLNIKAAGIYFISVKDDFGMRKMKLIIR